MKQLDFCLIPVALYYLMSVELWLHASTFPDFIRFVILIPALIYLFSRFIAARFQTVSIRFKPQFVPRCYTCEERGRKYWVEKISEIVETWDPTHKRSVKVYRNTSCWCSNKHIMAYHPEYGTFISGVGPRSRGSEGWMGKMSYSHVDSGARSTPAPVAKKTSRRGQPAIASGAFVEPGSGNYRQPSRLDLSDMP